MALNILDNTPDDNQSVEEHSSIVAHNTNLQIKDGTLIGTTLRLLTRNNTQLNIPMVGLTSAVQAQIDILNSKAHLQNTDLGTDNNQFGISYLTTSQDQEGVTILKLYSNDGGLWAALRFNWDYPNETYIMEWSVDSGASWNNLLDFQSLNLSDILIAGNSADNVIVLTDGDNYNQVQNNQIEIGSLTLDKANILNVDFIQWIKNLDSYSVKVLPNPATTVGNHEILLPVTGGNLALTTDYTLQSVTDNGSNTTNNISVYNMTPNISVIYDGNESFAGLQSDIDKGYLQLGTNIGDIVNIMPNSSLASSIDLQLPIISGTLALTTDYTLDQVLTNGNTSDLGFVLDNDLGQLTSLGNSNDEYGFFNFISKDFTSSYGGNVNFRISTEEGMNMSKSGIYDFIISTNSFQYFNYANSNEILLSDDFLKLTHSNGTNTSGIFIDGGSSLDINSMNLTDNTRISLNQENLTIYSSFSNFEGLRYEQDYSADYVDRSLIDLGYLNSQIGLAERIASLDSDGLVTWEERNVIGNMTIVKQLSDFPADVAGVITLANDWTYYIIGTVDLSGRRLVLGSNTSIQGNSNNNSILKSTGLNLDPLLTSVYSVNIKYITLESLILFDFVAGAGSLACNFTDITIKNATTIGTISGYLNILFNISTFTGSTGLTIGGTIGSLVMNSCYVNCTTGTFLTVPSTATVSTRIRIIVSTFAIGTGATGINVNTSATIGTESYILNSCNFSGLGTYVTGVQPEDNKSLSYLNKGITNSAYIGQYYMQDNATGNTVAAANTFYKANGTTTVGSYIQKFTHTDNRLTYDGVIPIYVKADCNCSILGGATNQVYRGRFAKNGTTISSSETKGKGDFSGTIENMKIQDIILLNPGDYIEFWVATTTVNNYRVVDMNLTLVKLD